MTLDDLAEHRSEWVQSVSRSFFNAEIHEMPPNGQGVVVLMTLGMLECFDWSGVDPDSAIGLHRQIEAFKLAAADVADCAADHAHDGTAMRVSVDELLDPAYLRARAALITDRAREPRSGLPARGGTVYVAAGDRSGRLVSLIQSNFAGFGSGVVVPGTGISLHNRAASFTFTPGHPNFPRGGKRPLHSIMPAMAMRNGTPLMSLGVTGGNMQPQGQIQLLMRILTSGCDPQAAIDAPRFRFMAKRDVNLESGFPDPIAGELTARGHTVTTASPRTVDFGSAQIVCRDGASWSAATDGRKDGAAVAW
jgi:gamma-glutamyltranspeptidase/glutathione hydrolase